MSATITPSRGEIIFPYLKPFSKETLKKIFPDKNDEFINVKPNFVFSPKSRSPRAPRIVLEAKEKRSFVSYLILRFAPGKRASRFKIVS